MHIDSGPKVRLDRKEWAERDCSVVVLDSMLLIFLPKANSETSRAS